MKKLLYVFLSFSILLTVLSCATSGLSRNSSASAQGVWHRVREGQTLWRIAKAYRVTLEEIKQANELHDLVHVTAVTWIRIPGAEHVLLVEGNLEVEQEQSRDMEFSWPLQGEVVTPYGKLEDDFSFGIDIRSDGNRDVLASQDGTVVLAGTIRGYGETIIIEHQNNFCTLYARNIRSTVLEGQRVKRNHVIARSEDARQAVHYEIFFEGKPVNPLFYLP
jgi:murein DD-endopeptidase MepM/ murein hydrolase activator NlpD